VGELVLVTGATGFVGAELLTEPTYVGVQIRATTRNLAARTGLPEVEWVRCCLARISDVESALRGVTTAYYLVHNVGGGSDYAARELRMAELFRDAAARAHVQRIIYLSPVPRLGNASTYLQSRLAIGEILRCGSVPTLELRTSMLVGSGSAPYRILRDVSLRLPALVLPAWTQSRISPLAVEDAVDALVSALDVPLPASRCMDLRGPESMTLADMLSVIPKLRRRYVPTFQLGLELPDLVLRAVCATTSVSRPLARELLSGIGGQELPSGESFWEYAGLFPQVPFEASALKTLGAEPFDVSPRGLAALIVEGSVHGIGRLLRRDSGSG